VYGKVFNSLWTGSMRGKSDLQLVFVFMISNCDARGILDMIPKAIADATGLPLERVIDAIRELEEGDPMSRTADFEGSRIARLDNHRDWGWLILNHEKYLNRKDLDRERSLTRERVRKHRNAVKRSVTLGNAIQTQIQTHKEKTLGQADARPSLSLISFEDNFWPQYPRKVGKAAASKAWKKLTQAELDHVMDGLRRYKATEWQGREIQFIPHAASWLNGRRWDDDLASTPTRVSPEPQKRPRNDFLEKVKRWKEEHDGRNGSEGA